MSRVIVIMPTLLVFTSYALEILALLSLLLLLLPLLWPITLALNGTIVCMALILRYIAKKLNDKLLATKELSVTRMPVEEGTGERLRFVGPIVSFLKRRIGRQSITKLDGSDLTTDKKKALLLQIRHNCRGAIRISIIAICSSLFFYAALRLYISSCYVESLDRELEPKREEFRSLFHRK